MADERLWRREADSEIYDNVTSGLPVLEGEERAAAQRALAAYEAMPAGSTPDQITKLIGSISWMPRQDGGAEAAKMQLAVYKTTLSDIDYETLAAAVREAVKTMTFFPSIAELRAIAAKLPAPARQLRIRRLRKMLAQGSASCAKLAAPVEVRALAERLGSAPPRQPRGPLRLPEPGELEAIAASLLPMRPMPAELLKRADENDEAEAAA